MRWGQQHVQLAHLLRPESIHPLYVLACVWHLGRSLAETRAPLICSIAECADNGNHPILQCTHAIHHYI